MSGERDAALLGADDPPPVRVHNPAGRSSFLLTGDHAGIAIPAALGSLGVGEADLARHIASDIGVSGLGRMLAEILDACFIEQVYSRLVIDCNRPEDHVEAMPESSDGTPVSGNAGLGEVDRTARIRSIHAPYHAALTEAIAGRDARGQKTILIALHSFTPVMAGVVRPWDIGILHGGGDTGFALALIDRLRRTTGVSVGDNEPYRMDETDHSVPRHAFAARRPYAEIEIRQDHLGDATGQALWAERLARALREAGER